MVSGVIIILFNDKFKVVYYSRSTNYRMWSVYDYNSEDVDFIIWWWGKC